MKKFQSSSANQTTNISYTNWLWNYGKQALKGIGVMGVGVLGYVGLRGYWQSQSVSTQAKPESTDLVTATDTTTAVVDKGLTATALTSTGGQSVWDGADQSVRYRRKRGVVPVIGEFRANTYTNDVQVNPAIASLNNGDFVIAWQSNGQDGSGWGVYAQRFAANGVPISNEFQVNTYNTSDQIFPAIAGMSNGGFVITWSSFGQDGDNYGIYAQMFDLNSAHLGGEFQVNSYTTNAQTNPAIISLVNGDFVIAWQCYYPPNTGWEVHAQRFALNGTKIASYFSPADNPYGDQISPAIASSTTGGFMIAWTTDWNFGAGAFSVWVKCYANTSVPLTSAFMANTYFNNQQHQPTVTGLSNGSYAVAWQSRVQDGSGYGVYAQLFDANCTRLGGEFQVNTYTPGDQLDPAITGLPTNSSEFVITWTSVGQDGDGNGVFAQRFTSNGTLLGSEFQVNSFINGSQSTPAIASLADSDFVITWAGDGQNGTSSDIYARMFKILYTSSELVHNVLTIDQGQTLVLTPIQLLALTESVPLSNLILVGSNVAHGWFANANNPTVPIFNFTQVEVNNGQIQFTHDNSYSTPGYQIAIFDGINMTTPQSVAVNFDQKPRWINNQIPIANGKQIRLSLAELLVTDDKNNGSVFFDARNISHGVFAYSFTADPFNYPISNFTQYQVDINQVIFVHDASNIAPSCEIRASDGRLYTAYQPCQFLFTPNRPPQLTRNELTLVKGDQKVIDGTSLAATDPDAMTTAELGQLIFNFTVVERGQFVLTTNQSLAVNWAYQSQVAGGQLIFKHDGSDQAPNYNVTVSDGYAVTESQQAKIAFSLAAPTGAITRDNTNVITGAAVGATGGAILLAGVGIFGAYRYRRSKQLEEQRSNYPLANALYHELNIAGTEDFQSEKGINFINAVDSLNNELIRAGVDIKQMVPEEIEELAHKLANATKAQLGKNINPLDIQDYAQGIVATAMTLSGKRKAEEGDVELDVVVRGGNRGRKLLLDILDARLQEEGFDMQTLSAERLKLLTEQYIKIIRKDFVESDTQNATDSQAVKAWRPGAIAN